MAYFTGPNIITDGLTFALDAGSTRSYSGSGTTSYNIINNQAGTLNNNVSFDSNYGGFFDFDGVDDYIEFADNNAYSFTNAQVTWEAFVRPTGNSGVIEHNIMCKANYGLNTREYQFQVRYTGGVYYFYLAAQNQSVTGWTSLGSTSATPININQWYHILVTSNGSGNAQMYIDGELKDSSTAFLTNMTNLGAPLIVGATINNTTPIQEFVGDISICRLYSKHFSQAEVLQNFNAQKSRFGL
jgi:hypothetical protein